MSLCVCSLEVTLEKQREGVEWTSLKEEEGASEDGTSSGLPLRGPVTDALSSEELEELKKKVAEITGSNKEVKTTQNRCTCTCTCPT